MRTTREQAEAATWGTGHGNRRHLVGEVKDLTYDVVAVYAACSSSTYPTPLTVLDDSETRTSWRAYDRKGNPKTDRDIVLSRKPCARCAKKAEVPA
jgi:hypothetical protein